MTTASHSGQKVLITGAASGIGWCMAQHFLAAGASVMVADTNVQAIEELQNSQTDCAATVCDVSDHYQTRVLVEKAVAVMGGLSILINNAGTSGPSLDVEHLSFQEWRDCLGVNLDGVFSCSHFAIPHLKANGGGSILNLSSTAGLYGLPRRAPYATAKWAIRGLTRTLAQELGPFRIRVNCLCPGSVAGPRIDSVIARDAASSGQSVDAVRQSYQSASSLGVFMEPQDIANAALFLTSTAGQHISGIDFVLDGHTETF